MCISLCVHIAQVRGEWVTEEAGAAWPSGTGVTGSRELPGVSAGNWTQVLCKAACPFNSWTVSPALFIWIELFTFFSNFKWPANTIVIFYFHKLLKCVYMSAGGACVRACRADFVCVCARERERERQRQTERRETKREKEKAFFLYPVCTCLCPWVDLSGEEPGDESQERLLRMLALALIPCLSLPLCQVVGSCLSSC